MSDPLFDFTDRVAVVTGGMGKLGRAYACALAERGARVAVVDTMADAPAGDAAFVAHLAAGRVAAFPADITDRGALEQAVDAIAAAWGVPHILVNNAAIDAPPDAPLSENGPFETYPAESLDRILAVNVKGAVQCCQVVGGRMARAGRGAIVNISSIYGLLSPVQDIYGYRRRGGEDFYKPVGYSVSKSAILNLTRYLATYWARAGVRVNTLTLAGVFDDQHPEFLKAYCERMPLGRMARREEAVGPLLFLVSDAASYVTGANLVADGGWTAW
ncbi:MAG: SDR family oxidoreductase [Xanthobacteraceae bacterium]|nr:SDR family oxidoreductase [Xanthobacteraceae bacterium]